MINKITAYVLLKQKEIDDRKLKKTKKSKKKMKKQKPRCGTPTEELIQKVESLHHIFKRYEQRKKIEMESVQRELAENNKHFRKHETKQKEFLLLIRQAEAERRAKEIKKIKQIALAHRKRQPSDAQELEKNAAQNKKTYTGSGITVVGGEQEGEQVSVIKPVKKLRQSESVVKERGVAVHKVNSKKILNSLKKFDPVFFSNFDLQIYRFRQCFQCIINKQCQS